MPIYHDFNTGVEIEPGIIVGRIPDWKQAKERFLSDPDYIRKLYRLDRITFCEDIFGATHLIVYPVDATDPFDVDPEEFSEMSKAALHEISYILSER